MRALRLHRHDAAMAGVRLDGDVAEPEIAADELLVRARAAGVNPVDAKIAQGWKADVLGHRLPLVIGWDLAGEVAAAGPAAGGFAVGDRVMGRPDLFRDGCFADFVAIRADACARVPDAVPLVDAAGIPVAALTAWTALFDHARPDAGQTVLIHGGAGGVGMFAVQLARLAGARVVATASAANADFVAWLGADLVLDYRDPDWPRQAGTIDAVIDGAGGETQARSLPLLREGGVLVCMAGPVPDLAGYPGLRARFCAMREGGGMLAQIGALVARGDLRTFTARSLPLEQGIEALRLVSGGHARGKTVLTLA